MNLPDWLLLSLWWVVFVLNVVRAHRRIALHSLVHDESENITRKQYALLMRAFSAVGHPGKELRLVFEYIWTWALLIYLTGELDSTTLKVLWGAVTFIMLMGYFFLYLIVRQSWTTRYIRNLHSVRWRRQQNRPIFRAP